MSYSKRNTYPSIKTPGVYPDDYDDKQIGLDNDDLENFSLGNWNSIYKGNKIFLSGDLLSDVGDGVKVQVRTTPPRHGTRVVVWRYRRNPEQTSSEDAILLAQGPIIEYLSDAEQIDSMGNDINGVKASRLFRTKAVYNQFYEQAIGGDDYGLNGQEDDMYSISFNRDSLRDDRAITFDNGYGTIKPRSEGQDIVLTFSDNNRYKLEQYHAFERELSDDEIDWWGSGASDRGDDKRFTHELVVMVEFDVRAMNIDDQTFESFSDRSYRIFEPNMEVEDGGTTGNLNEAYIRNYPTSSANAVTLRGLEYRIYRGPDKASINHPFMSTNENWSGQYHDGNFTTRDNLTMNATDGFGYYHSQADFVAHIGAVSWVPGYRTDVKLGSDFWNGVMVGDGGLRFLPQPTLDMGNYDKLPQEPNVPSVPVRNSPFIDDIEDIEEKFLQHFNLIGFPNFESSIAIDDPTYVEELVSSNTPVDFLVNAKTNDGNIFTYYDSEQDSELYVETSYPVRVNVDIDLLNYPDFTNTKTFYNESDIISAFQGSGEGIRNYLTNEMLLPHYALTPNECYYKYQVIQWGDEKQLLTDEQIENSYYFNFYNLETYPIPGDFFYRKYQQSQEISAAPIKRNGQAQVSRHVYNTPGIKNIKIILYRYDARGAFILQTYLITKNIVIGDGVVKSQDFSIFGGGDFNFLPIIENQAIIGGFDTDSKYNNSVEKIVKDDQFLKEDYLDRISSRDYIDKTNNNFLGKNIGQINLGQTRLFNRPKDIYNFIGGNKLEWLNNGSGSLPLNSLATDIFIDDEDCLVNLNPSITNYSVIENTSGLAKGIPVGDYELNQPEDGSVTKQGIMETPELDSNNDRQAF